jgi:uncharacterized protein YecE (DUF72 family)
MRGEAAVVRAATSPGTVQLGTAGWSVSARYLKEIPVGGSHLERYARAFPVAEITTSFYRHHKPETYARWARSVGADFGFAVKTPRALTHEGALVLGKSAVLDRFLAEVAGLEGKLRVLLVQLPPTLTFDAAEAGRFFRRLKAAVPPTVALVCEPRHITWAAASADQLLLALGVSRAAVDPARWTADAEPGGDRRLAYFRLHGSPRIYFSDYEPQRLEQLTGALQAASRNSRQVWCIFDNTAHGHAIGNALVVQRAVENLGLRREA